MITYEDILESGEWDKWCEIKGFNPWFLNEGRGSSTDSAGDIIGEYIAMHRALKIIASNGTEPQSAAIAMEALNRIW